MTKLRENMTAFATDVLEKCQKAAGIDGETQAVMEVCAFMHVRVQGGNGGSRITSFVKNELPKNDLVCFRSVVYPAFQAFDIDGNKLKALELLTGDPKKPNSEQPAEFLARLGSNDAVSEKDGGGVPPAGSAVFFTSPSKVGYGHVALSIGSGHVMSCNTPTNVWKPGEIGKKEFNLDLALLLAAKKAALAPFELVKYLCGPDYAVSWTAQPFWRHWLTKTG